MRILLAVDGTPGSLGALRLAFPLIRRQGGEIRALLVAEPPMETVSGYPFPVPPIEAERALVQATVDRVAGLLREEGGDDGWSLQMAEGVPARTITAEAERWGADFLVLGLGRRRIVDRVLGNDVAPRVAQLTTVPVLAVPGDATELPTSAVVAVDFSAPSLEAARLAAILVGHSGTLTLLHVGSTGLGPGMERWTQAYREAAREALERLGEKLAADPAHPVRVRTQVERDDPAARILQVAEGTDAGLIAMGTHGRGMAGRVLLGRVSTRVLRGSERSVLLVPPGGAPPPASPPTDSHA